MKVIRSYFTLFTVAGILVALDQWTKNLVRTNIPVGGMWLPEGWENLTPYARVVHWHNSGAAFGMFKDGAPVFTILAFVVIIAILFFYREVEQGDWYLRVALMMQMGGAIGNLTDRLLFEGVVTDWVSIGKFAVFNVADASITVGTAVMVLGIFIMERRERQAKRENAIQNEMEMKMESPSGEEASV